VLPQSVAVRRTVSRMLRLSMRIKHSSWRGARRGGRCFDHVGGMAKNTAIILTDVCSRSSRGRTARGLCGHAHPAKRDLRVCIDV